MSSPKKKIELLFLCLILTVFAVLLSCSNDEENITVNGFHALSAFNEAEVAKIFVFDSDRLEVSNTAIIGKAPLSIAFNSVYGDEQGIKGYAWDFGSEIAPSALKRMKRTFEHPGIYEVKLTVRDAQGRTYSDTVKITLAEDTDSSLPAEIYVFESEKLDVSKTAITGEAPLSIAFNSVYGDEYGIKGYSWDFGSGIAPSALKRMKRTFQNPGIYNVKLTVRDAQGLTATDNVIITLTGEDDKKSVSSSETLNSQSIDCSEGGGMADDTGAKIWCWGDISIPDYTGQGVALSNR
uniref:PKD domain-containing protein n=1 Tax=Pareuzebyella sediminis TaxID=2607998 RepID=UPI0011EC3427